MDLSIIIPCRDEYENVEIISENIKKKINLKEYEIIFINDFSNDKTEERLKFLSSQFKNIYFYNNLNKGLGGAIKLGLKKSIGKYITILMADSADDIDDLNKYIEIMKKNEYDAIFGSRFIKGGKTINYPIIKLMMNRLANNFIKVLFWYNFNDFTNSFKIYKKDIINNLEPLISENFNIFLELSLKTIIRGFKIKVIPISYTNRTVGVAKFKIKEVGSSYLFTAFYCFLEKILLDKRVK